MNKEIYVFQQKASTKHEQMFTLVSQFVKKEVEEIFGSRVMFPFSVYSNEKDAKTFHAISQDERDMWVRIIQKSLCYSNFLDFYELKEVLGEGKFGVVRKALHRKTQKEVAVKILEKAKMESDELELVKREVEILKLCQHPHIIRLLDLFENSEKYFIVIELVRGGDLFGYLSSRGFKIPEQEARKIIHSLATALYYLHSYGIVHRDIKPENVLIGDVNDTSSVKIADFGLSKIIGPEETCSEPFGTLTYTSPEILVGKAYTKQVDIWSLGVMGYLMLTGTLPFNSTSKERIAKKIVYEEVHYDLKHWKCLSINSQVLINKMLTKNPSRRITLEKLLIDDWITHTCKDVKNLRIGSKEVNEQRRNSFQMYSLVNPITVPMNDIEQIPNEY